jgi:hypothetical protein
MSEDVNVIADYAEVWLVGDDIERAGRRIYQVTDFDQSTNGLIVRCLDETGWSETVWAFPEKHILATAIKFYREAHGTPRAVNIPAEEVDGE